MERARGDSGEVSPVGGESGAPRALGAVDEVRHLGPGDAADADGAVGAEEAAEADDPLPEIPIAATPPSRRRGPARRIVLVALAVAVAGGVAWFVVSSAPTFTRAVGLMQRMDRRWAAVAVAAEVASYIALSLHLRYLGGREHNARRLAPFRLSLIVFGLGNVLPAAPAEGILMAGAALRRRRLAKRRAVLVLTLSQWFSTAALYAVAAIDVLVVSALARVALPGRPAVVLFATGTLGTLFAIGWLSSRRSVAEWAALASDRLRFWRPTPATEDSRERGAAWHDALLHVVAGPRGVLYLSSTAALAWLADATCLHFALVAFGVHISPDVLLLAYTAGMVGSMVPMLPAGAGVVETVTPAVLALAGVPVFTALAAIVVYRVIATLLPAAAGLVALAAMRVGEPTTPDAGSSDLPGPAGSQEGARWREDLRGQAPGWPPTPCDRLPREDARPPEPAALIGATVTAGPTPAGSRVELWVPR